jgi:hypothetical protein
MGQERLKGPLAWPRFQIEDRHGLSMRNICLLLALLLVPYVALAAFGVPGQLRGRIGIACVFTFTGMGHFFLAKPMSGMIPPRLPERCRLPIIYVTGIIELGPSAS